MPISHIHLQAGKPDKYREAIMDGLYQALQDALDVPDDDQFMTITEHDSANFRFGNAFGINRSEDLVYIRITMFDNRTVNQKIALYRQITELLGNSPGIRSEDLFITATDSPKENWSVGNGEAQFV